MAHSKLIANLFRVHKKLASRARVVVICGGPMALPHFWAYRKKLDEALLMRLRNLEYNDANG